MSFLRASTGSSAATVSSRIMVVDVNKCCFASCHHSESLPQRHDVQRTCAYLRYWPPPPHQRSSPPYLNAFHRNSAHESLVLIHLACPKFFGRALNVKNSSLTSANFNGSSSAFLALRPASISRTLPCSTQPFASKFACAFALLFYSSWLLAACPNMRDICCIPIAPVKLWYDRRLRTSRWPVRNVIVESSYPASISKVTIVARRPWVVTTECTLSSRTRADFERSALSWTTFLDQDSVAKKSQTKYNWGHLLLTSHPRKNDSMSI